ncbi:MAG: hypothetical protein U0905_19880 [Pirellulales bacterium]
MTRPTLFVRSQDDLIRDLIEFASEPLDFCQKPFESPSIEKIFEPSLLAIGSISMAYENAQDGFAQSNGMLR